MVGAVASLSVATAVPAQAEATVIDNFGYRGVAMVCKVRVETGYGPLYRLTLFAASGQGWAVSAGIYVVHNGQPIDEKNVNSRDGVWSHADAYAFASPASDYYIRSSYGSLDGRGGGSGYEYRGSVANIGNC